MYKSIARITGTFLGASEDTHGVFTAELRVEYGDHDGQTVGGYGLGGHSGFGIAFIQGVLDAVGVASWEQLVGRTVLILTEHEPPAVGQYNPVLGIENLPTEPGGRFLFGELVADYRRRGAAGRSDHKTVPVSAGAGFFQ